MKKREAAEALAARLETLQLLARSRTALDLLADFIAWDEELELERDPDAKAAHAYMRGQPPRRKDLLSEGRGL